MKTHQYVILMAILLCGSIAYAQDFSTNSDMMNSGSKYASSVSEVGAEGIEVTPFPNQGPRRAVANDNDPFGEGAEHESGQDEGFPIGEPWILVILAGVAAGVIALKHQKHTKTTN